MGLDSYYGSKSLDAIKKEFFNQMSYEELVEKVNETMKVSTRDIDQKWVRENEAKDMIYDEPKKEPLPQFQEMKLDKDIQDMLDGMKNGVITPNQTRDEQKAKEANINYINELDDLINSIGSAFDEPKIEDNSAIIQEIKSSIDKKSNYIQSELSQLYNNETIQAKANDLRQDLTQIMSLNMNDLDTLQKQEKELDELISRITKVQALANEIKVAEELKAQQALINANINSLQNNPTQEQGTVRGR